MDYYAIYPKQIRKKNIPVEKDRCFFLMPFSHEYDIVYGTIKKSLNDNDIICNRADEISGSTPIIAKILFEMARSQFIIVDITDSNPNVYYELGIAHTLKEARNVLLIKRKDYKAPFDITHLTYIEYEKNNLILLVSHILSFLNENKKKNALYDALKNRGLINSTDDSNEFVELIEDQFPAIVILLSKALAGEGKELIESDYTILVSSFQLLTNSLSSTNKMEMLSQTLDVFFDAFSLLPENSIVYECISAFLNDLLLTYKIPNPLVLEYKTRLVLLLAKNHIYMNQALPWIINYFSRSKSTTIDLNRYKIESFLMTTQSNEINDAIINSICNPDCYIREHMSDIIGEKKLEKAFPLLLVQLEKETNYFTAQSMIEAIKKLNNPAGLTVIESWVNQHKQDIINTKQLFVLKHAFFAIAALDKSDNQNHINEFKKEFGEVLKDYYII